MRRDAREVVPYGEPPVSVRSQSREAWISPTATRLYIIRRRRYIINSIGIASLPVPLTRLGRISLAPWGKYHSSAWRKNITHPKGEYHVCEANIFPLPVPLMPRRSGVVPTTSCATFFYILCFAFLGVFLQIFALFRSIIFRARTREEKTQKVVDNTTFLCAKCTRGGVLICVFYVNVYKN